MGCMLFPTNSQRCQSSQGIIAPLLNAYDIFTLVNYFKILPLLLTDCYLPITNRRGENCRWFGRFQPQLLSWAPSSPLVLQPGGWRDSSGQQKVKEQGSMGQGPDWNLYQTEPGFYPDTLCLKEIVGIGGICLGLEAVPPTESFRCISN